MSGRGPYPSWVDGRLVPPGEPALPADALGVVHGLGLFETLAFVAGERPFEDLHLARLERGARVLGLRFERAAARTALAEYAHGLAGSEAGPGHALALRLALIAGAEGRAPHLVVGAREVELAPPEGVEVALEPRALLAGDPLSALKTIARPRYAAARRRARERGAWDALLGSDEGDFLEASVSNLFVVVGERLLTPALERGCLPGITRGRLLAALRARGAAVEEGRVLLRDLAAAREVFLTNCVTGLVPVRAVQGTNPRLAGPGGAWTELARTLLAAGGSAPDKGPRPGPARSPDPEESP